MKTILNFTVLMFLTLSLSNCAKKGCTDPVAKNYQSKATKDDGSCSYNYGGKEYAKLSVGLINEKNDYFKIYIDGIYEGTIDKYFNHSDFCGSYDAIEKNVKAGTHLVEIEGVYSGIQAYGYVDVEEQECHAYAINYALNGSSSGGGGGSGSGSGSGGGSGGGTTTGDATFWINSDFGCGQITVTMNGSTRTINNYYSSIPSCGSTGCANFSGVSAGTYSYSAECSSYTWNGSITVSAGGCSRMQLTI